MTLGQIYEYLHNSNQFKHDDRTEDAIRSLLQMQRAYHISSKKDFTKPAETTPDPTRRRLVM